MDDRVERAAPHARGRRPVGSGAAQEPVHPAKQLGRGPPSEGEQEDALGGHPPGDELSHAVGEGGGLPGAGAGHDEQRTAAVVEHRLALLVVERLEHGGRRG